MATKEGPPVCAFYDPKTGGCLLRAQIIEEGMNQAFKKISEDSSYNPALHAAIRRTILADKHPALMTSSDYPGVNSSPYSRDMCRASGFDTNKQKNECRNGYVPNTTNKVKAIATAVQKLLSGA